MNFKTLLFLILISFCFFSCKKRVENISPEFIGKWECNAGDDWFYNLDIDENSFAVYSEIGASYNSFKGDARTNSTKLTIKRIHTFKIIQYPSRIDTANSDIFIDYPNKIKKANWKMELEGPKLWLGTGTYYMADY